LSTATLNAFDESAPILTASVARIWLPLLTELTNVDRLRFGRLSAYRRMHLPADRKALTHCLHPHFGIFK
jgi:hypothetical protein